MEPSAFFTANPKKSQQKNRPWKVDGIRIRPMPNRTGEFSFRVEVPARVTGNRILKQFKTREEASAYAARMVFERQNSGLSGFALNDAERADAKRALGLLKPFRGVRLTAAAEFYLKHFMPEGGDVTIDQLIEKYEDHLEREEKVRPRSLGNVQCRLRHFAGLFGQRFAKEVGVAEIRAWLKSDPEWSDQSQLNYKRTVHALFEFARGAKYVADNPAREIEVRVAETAEPQILSAEQASAILNAALAHPELELGWYITLGLFCGIRAEELAKLKVSDVQIENRMVNVSAKIAKRRRVRNVPFTVDLGTPAESVDVVTPWLAAFPTPKNGMVTPIGFNKRFTKLRKAAKITDWPPNGLRHTFGSFYFALTSNAHDTCARLGHRGGDDILFKHYRALTTHKQATAFFRLSPPADGKITQMPGAVRAA